MMIWRLLASVLVVSDQGLRQRRKTADAEGARERRPRAALQSKA
jgi:hypothetical protein